MKAARRERKKLVAAAADAVAAADVVAVVDLDGDGGNDDGNNWNAQYENEAGGDFDDD